MIFDSCDGLSHATSSLPYLSLINAEKTRLRLSLVKNEALYVKFAFDATTFATSSMFRFPLLLNPTKRQIRCTVTLGTVTGRTLSEYSARLILCSNLCLTSIRSSLMPSKGLAASKFNSIIFVFSHLLFHQNIPQLLPYTAFPCLS